MRDEQDTDSFFEIIKYFTGKNDYFFNLYMEFCEFYSEEETVRLRAEIPKYFKLNGLFLDTTEDNLMKGWKRKFFEPSIHAIGMLPMNAGTYEILPIICGYYLGVTLFKPASEWTWEKFVDTYEDYKMQPGSFFIEKGYTDCVIAYSEGLIVWLDMTKHNIKKITEDLKARGIVWK